MNNEIEITLNNTKKITVPYKSSVYDIALNNSDVCSKKIVGAKINNEIVDFNKVITRSVNIDFFDINCIEGYKMNQSGLKFVLEVALKENFSDGIDVSYDHSIGNGIHTTILNVDKFDEDDVKKLKQCMDELIRQNIVIRKLNVESKELVNFFEKVNQVEKAKNIHNLSDNLLILYKLNNCFNYFYSEMPYSTGFLNDFELMYIDNKELSLTLPTNCTFSLVEYKNYNKVTDCFKLDNKMLNIFKLPYVCDINDIVSMGRSRDLIRLFETRFDNKLHDVAIDVIEKGIKFLFIAGPSSSGKTTTAKKLALNLRTEGYETILISTDDYFVDYEKTPRKEDGTFDLESIDALDIDSFIKDMKDLADGKSVILPTYNFKKGKREYGDTKTRFYNKGIIIVEGIHCLNDKLSKGIDDNLKYKIYLSPFISLKIDRHNYLSTTDLRLIRRIIRDNNNRGTSVAKTLELWQSVREGEEENIFPFIEQANVIINTALPYELGVLKVFAEPLLYSVNNDSPYLEEARRLIKYLQYIYPIPSEYVEEDSIIREFIGGSVFKREGDI